MDAEFHYYVTYLAAVFAGFNSTYAYKIAYSSQYVDDNSTQYKITNGYNISYCNAVTQSYNAFLSKEAALEIYPVFHFLPGTYHLCANLRCDAKLHPMATSPNNFLAKAVLRAALNSENLYWIGIASHAFCDTWAHQNFTGTNDEFNSTGGLIEQLIPNIGHADYLGLPDKIGLIWYDNRLKVSKVNNNERFLCAAANLFSEYKNHLKGKVEHQRTIESFIGALKKIWGEPRNCKFDLFNNEKQERIIKYNKLLSDNSKITLSNYNEFTWFNQAADKLSDATYYWKKDDNESSNWYQFQEAAKRHKEFALPFINERLKKYES